MNYSFRDKSRDFFSGVSKRIFWCKAVVIITVMFASVVWGKSTPPNKNQELYYQIQGELVCLCGCGGLLIKDCFCGNADKIRDFLRDRIEAGKGDKEIKAEMVKIHGEKVLAEPISPTAKIIIGIMLILGMIFLVKVLQKWRSNKIMSPDDGEQLELSKEEKKYDSRIDEELKDLDL